MRFFCISMFRQSGTTLFFFILLSLISVKAHACPKQVKADDIATNLLEQRMLIVGETHGTNEMPDYVGRLVCAQLQIGKKVILGLEYSSSTQLALNAYLRSKGSKEDQAALYQALKLYSADGRASQAMFRLMETMRQANVDGKAILLLAFDDPIYPEPLTPNEKYKSYLRDIVMAEQIRYRALVYPDYQFVIYVGSYHASKELNQHRLLDFENMGYVLKKRMSVYTLLFTYNNGQAWIMQKDGKAGVRELGSTANTPHDGFDKVLNFPTITASQPFQQ